MRQTDGRQAFMGSVDQEFFVDLGKRITALRKQRGLTQVQVADALGFSHTQILSFEKGRRRLPVSLLPELATILETSVEELLGLDKATDKGRGKRGPASKLEKQFQEITSLPRHRQKFFSDVLEGLLLQATG